MQIPPNYGQRYTQMFADIFPALSDSYNTALVPFFLDGIYDQENLMQGTVFIRLPKASPDCSRTYGRCSSLSLNKILQKRESPALRPVMPVVAMFHKPDMATPLRRVQAHVCTEHGRRLRETRW